MRHRADVEGCDRRPHPQGPGASGRDDYRTWHPHRPIMTLPGLGRMRARRLRIVGWQFQISGLSGVTAVAATAAATR
jgi:hypothetical protein